MPDGRDRGYRPRDEGRRERHEWQCPACDKTNDGRWCGCGKTGRIPCPECGQWFVHFRGELTNRCPKGHLLLLEEERKAREATLRAEHEEALGGLRAEFSSQLEELRAQIVSLTAERDEARRVLQEAEPMYDRLEAENKKLQEEDGGPIFLRDPVTLEGVVAETLGPTIPPSPVEPPPLAPLVSQKETSELRPPLDESPAPGHDAGGNTGNDDNRGGGGNGENRDGEQGGQPRDQEGGSFMRDVIAVGLSLLAGGAIIGAVLFGWRWPLIGLAVLAGALTLPFLAALVMAPFVKKPPDWPETAPVYLKGIIRNVPTNQVWILRNAWYSNPGDRNTPPKGYYAKPEGWHFWIPYLWHIDLGLVSLVPVIRDPTNIVVNTRDNQTVEVDWRMETVIPSGLDVDRTAPKDPYVSAKKFKARAEQSREDIEVGNASAIINLLCSAHNMSGENPKGLTNMADTEIVTNIADPAKRRFNDEPIAGEPEFRGVLKYYGIKAIRIDVQKFMPPEVLRDEAAHRAAAAVRADAAAQEAIAYEREVGGVVGTGAPPDARAAVGPALIWGRTIRDIKNVLPEIAAAIFGGRGKEERR